MRRIWPQAVALAAFLIVSAPAYAYVVKRCTPGERSNVADQEMGWKPDCGGVFNLCGYVDRNGRQVIPHQFEVALSFSENLAAVRVDGKFGFIDRAGRVIVPPKFDLSGPMSGGHAEILVGDRVGIVSKTGEIVAQPNFARAFPFGLDRALVLEGSFKSRGIIDCDSLAPIRSNQLNDLVSRKPSSYRLLDLKNGQLSDRSYHIKVFDRLSRGLIWARYPDEYSFFGLLRSDGTWQVEPKYRQVGPLRDGYVEVCGGPGKMSDGQSNCGALDESGSLVKPMIFHPNMQWGNKPVKETENRAAVVSCSNGVEMRRQSGKYVFMSVDGRQTEPYLFDDIHPRQNCSGPIGVKLGEVWGFVGSDGHLLGGPPRFNTFYPFANGYAVVSLDHKWGIIDRLGGFSVAPKYDRLRPDDDAFRATLNGEEFWIDAKDNRVSGPSRKEDRAAVLNCRSDGGRLIMDKSSGAVLWGLADEAGKIVVKPKYRAMRCFQNGLAWVADDARRKWCQIDKFGNVRNEHRCSAGFNGVVIFDAGREKFSDDAYESLVLWERALLDYGRGVRQEPPRIVTSRF